MQEGTSVGGREEGWRRINVTDEICRPDLVRVQVGGGHNQSSVATVQPGFQAYQRGALTWHPTSKSFSRLVGQKNPAGLEPMRPEDLT